MEKGSRKAGYAAVTLEGIVETKALPPGASAQKAGLIVLTRAWELPQEKRVNVYTDSRKNHFLDFAHTWFNLEGKRTINLQ